MVLVSDGLILRTLCFKNLRALGLESELEFQAGFRTPCSNWCGSSEMMKVLRSRFWVEPDAGLKWAGHEDTHAGWEGWGPCLVNTRTHTFNWELKWLCEVSRAPFAHRRRHHRQKSC